MTCYVSNNIAAPCQQGHDHDGPVHVVGEATETNGLKKYDAKFWCAHHCPIHGAQQMMEWKEPAKTITGEQEGLF